MILTAGHSRREMTYLLTSAQHYPLWYEVSFTLYVHISLVDFYQQNPEIRAAEIQRKETSCFWKPDN